MQLFWISTSFLESEEIGTVGFQGPSSSRIPGFHNRIPRANDTFPVSWRLVFWIGLWSWIVLCDFHPIPFSYSNWAGGLSRPESWILHRTWQEVKFSVVFQWMPIGIELKCSSGFSLMTWFISPCSCGEPGHSIGWELGSISRGFWDWTPIFLNSW